MSLSSFKEWSLKNEDIKVGDKVRVIFKNEKGESRIVEKEGTVSFVGDRIEVLTPNGGGMYPKRMVEKI